jgi:hypothetical protein
MKFKAHAFHKALSQAEISKNVCLELPCRGPVCACLEVRETSPQLQRIIVRLVLEKPI